jgi:hypothetical protein
VLIYGVYDWYERMAGAHIYERKFHSEVQPSAGSIPHFQLMEMSYDFTHYHPGKSSLAEETLLVEIS